MRANSGVSSNAILIGQSVALTGPFGELGNEYRAGAQLTLPVENVSLAECFNASKENGNDEEDDEGAVHARVQARGGAAGRGPPESWPPLI